MKAVLLAAGFGTRLRPLTNTIPKCLVPILGKPLLAIWLDRLFASGKIDRVLVNTHYLSERVVEHVAQSPWKEKIDLVYEPVLLGTAGTLWQNCGWIGDGASMVAHADNLTLFDVQEFIAAHESRPVSCPITMMTFDTDAPQTCGIVEEEHGVVVGFHEKVANPPGTRANAAVYIVEREVIDGMAAEDQTFIDMSTQILPQYIGKIFTYHNAVYHRDIGNLESLRLAELELPALGRSDLGI
jgi:mannose-1-phosphate guanylyltransferase